MSVVPVASCLQDFNIINEYWLVVYVEQNLVNEDLWDVCVAQ